MADIHLSGSSDSHINFSDPSMPKYVGARAEVTRTANGVVIWLKDYMGETTETIAEAIQSITTNADGSLTFTLPDGRTITTGPLAGTQGPQGPKGDTGEAGADGNGIASITKTGTQGLVDTYTITFTNGTTATFTVTNGRNGSGSVADVWVDGASVLDGDTAKVSLAGKANAVHTHTKSQITDFPTIPTTASDVGAIPTSAKGANNGVCPLNASGKIDATYLPVYNGGVS